jgi:hypothetical protein
MTDGVDARVDAMQQPDRDAVAHRRGAEAERAQLVQRNDTMLVGGEPRDPRLQRGAWCKTLTR